VEDLAFATERCVMTHTSRAEYRDELLARVPRRYSPLLHLAIPSLGGLTVAALALSSLRGLQAWQVAFVPLFLLIGNVIEWHAHRGLLHRRTRFLEVLYERHTPQHHMMYVADDMAIRSARELRFVLLPAYGLFAIVLVTSPVAVALGMLAGRNLAALWVASAALYVLSYEWLHLSYHLPPEGRIGRLALVQFLRRHHQFHHAPHLMQRWNFNVTLPVWDLVRGTAYHPAAAAAPAPAPASPRRAAR
jgi:fatty acid hydroxylase family protein